LPDKALHDLDASWEIWTMMEVTGWQFLPRAGGLLDQPSWLMDDLFAIRDAAYRREQQLRDEDKL
jgi:hypothetical protein